MADDDFRESITCLRCESEMEFAGTRQFHEGTRLWDFLGGLFELLKHREALDVYACKRCGKVEFFLSGVGEESRGGGPSLREVAIDIESKAGPVASTVPAIPPPPPPDPPAPPGSEPDAAAAGWTCAQCGEKNPENFEICWRCVTPRN
ncbi:MAG: hypothetical protein IT450_20255 [Phycisphaerales bacterium]|nr:hypothetical protein [Phycisphaerales bacterium]